MKLNTLIALAVAGAFTVPFAARASAASDNVVIAQAGGASGDYARNRDPHRSSTLDRNHDGKSSAQEDGKSPAQEYSGIEADRRAQGHGVARSATGSTGTGTSSATGRGPDKQPSADPRSESGTTK